MPQAPLVSAKLHMGCPKECLRPLYSKKSRKETGHGLRFGRILLQFFLYRLCSFSFRHEAREPAGPRSFFFIDFEGHRPSFFFTGMNMGQGQPPPAPGFSAVSAAACSGRGATFGPKSFMFTRLCKGFELKGGPETHQNRSASGRPQGWPVGAQVCTQSL